MPLSPPPLRLSHPAHQCIGAQIREQCDAFVRGVRSVAPLPWLRPFSEAELQVLISGTGVALDVTDMQRHTRYTGGYTSLDPTVKVRAHRLQACCLRAHGLTLGAAQGFWRIVRELSPEDKAALLRFVTSCPRVPPLGFAALHPPFCLQRVRPRPLARLLAPTVRLHALHGVADDAGAQVSLGSEPDRLPTASTCFNILKLPAYRDERTLREKLLTAIRSNAGFELS